MGEIVEICPFCEYVNIYPWDVKNQGYTAKCEHCGKEIMLCNECMNADDNPTRKCDWNCYSISDTETEGRCFRGITHNEVGGEV